MSGRKKKIVCQQGMRGLENRFLKTGKCTTLFSWVHGRSLCPQGGVGVYYGSPCNWKAQVPWNLSRSCSEKEMKAERGHKKSKPRLGTCCLLLLAAVDQPVVPLSKRWTMPGLRLPAGARAEAAPSSSPSLVCTSGSSNASAARQCGRHEAAEQSQHCCRLCRVK